MSYILEALKQAEEERGSDRLSKVIAVQQSDDPQQNSIDWKKWLTIAIFINAVVLFVWVAWKLVGITANNEGEMQTVKVEPLKPQQRPAIAEENVPVFANSTKPVVEKAPSEPSRKQVTKVEISVKPKAPAIVQEVVKKPQDLAAEKIKPEPLDADVVMADMIEDEPQGTRAVDQNKPKLAAVTETEVSAAKIEPLPKLPREELIIEEPEQVLSPEPEIAAPAEPEQIAVVQRQVPEFAELPYGLQQQIPDIRISVHIYNNEPQQRKVRINGQIFREDDEVDRGLTIEEITPLGVIFNYEETAFKLNLR